MASKISLVLLVALCTLFVVQQAVSFPSEGGSEETEGSQEAEVSHESGEPEKSAPGPAKPPRWGRNYVMENDSKYSKHHPISLSSLSSMLKEYKTKTLSDSDISKIKNHVSSLLAKCSWKPPRPLPPRPPKLGSAKN
uniref:Venom protein family 29 protein 1 n=1 Tax=Lethocerus distinctifemur TaxID=280095 RepID=A0A2K8JLC9_9HEMI|nr:venom protein family 29 protein 1 [Lethocerus distinctifemur]